ncbi:putative Late embryogenesis abundant protein, LEA-14 [Lupinus albus]|uniref:Putative Late embryogenesis abundant protein, LEA-14 n=1 Tax=Lupinus albus TaxID=3870 RepID=A0A6A4PYQ0_LUPAL|nr:putative Late embryogenesis abundant protein, LEA-14 [Lupinus albus]
MSEGHSRTNFASCVVATIFLSFIIIILLILYFTLFKPHHPHIAVTSITLPSYSLSNSTLTFTFYQYSSVTNPNRDVFSHFDSSFQLFFAGAQVGFLFIPAGHIDAGRTQHIAATFTVNSFHLSTPPPTILDPTNAVMAMEMETRMEMAGRVRVLHLFTHHVLVKAECRVAVSVTDGSVLGFRC